MSTKLGALGWALAIALLLFAIVSRGGGDDVELNRLRDESAARADSIRNSEATIVVADARIDSLRADSIAFEEAITREQKAREGVSLELDAALEALSVPSGVRDLLEAERASWRAEGDSLRAFAARQDLLRLAQIAARDSTLELYRRQEVTRTETISRLEDKLKPDLSLFGLAIRFKCVAGVGAVANQGSATAGVGAMCGVQI